MKNVLIEHKWIENERNNLEDEVDRQTESQWSNKKERNEWKRKK